MKFAISASFVDELECKVAPLEAYEVMFGIPYIWDSDATFYKKENKYRLVKDGKAYLVKARKGRENTTPLASK